MYKGLHLCNVSWLNILQLHRDAFGPLHLVALKHVLTNDITRNVEHVTSLAYKHVSWHFRLSQVCKTSRTRRIYSDFLHLHLHLQR
jgi:hypothetical protein